MTELTLINTRVVVPRLTPVNLRIFTVVSGRNLELNLHFTSVTPRYLQSFPVLSSLFQSLPGGLTGI